ncbi:S1 family peptidase [Nocardia sp. BMG51109]|uniref:S1 family peptidase n=1 Tax=Nocardia sp. BMG51109 TaxID=1056816 RepID=UPI0004AF0E30|nr:S1 family peptidase [Nocardia sp. BMG51109]
MTPGSRMFRTVLGCCAAVAVAVSTAPPVAADPGPDDVPLPLGLIEAVRRDLGIDAHEYLARVATAQRLSEFAKAARRTYPAVFGGTRMDGGRPIVMLTAGTPASGARRDAQKAGFVVETVADSEARLRDRQAAFERWLGDQPRSVADAIVGYGVDLLHNSLEIRATEDVRVPDAVGPVRSVVMAMPEVLPDDGPAAGRPIADAESTEPVVGGRPYAVELGGKTHRCSYGFNGTDAEGHAVNITAGHCDPGNLVDPAAKSARPQQVFDIRDNRRGDEIGHFEVSNFAPHDYSIIRIDDSAAPRFRNNLVSTERVAPPAEGAGSSAGWPSLGSSDAAAGDERDLLRIDGTADPVVGVPVCKSGFRSGYSCGPVLAVGQQGRLSDVPGHDGKAVEIEDMFVVNLCAQRGDSGGPIFAGTKAVGVNSAILTAATPLDQGCGHLPILLGQPIGTVLDDNPGLTVRTR